MNIPEYKEYTQEEARQIIKRAKEIQKNAAATVEAYQNLGEICEAEASKHVAFRQYQVKFAETETAKIGADANAAERIGALAPQYDAHKQRLEQALASARERSQRLGQVAGSNQIKFLGMGF